MSSLFLSLTPFPTDQYKHRMAENTILGFTVETVTFPVLMWTQTEEEQKVSVSMSRGAPLIPHFHSIFLRNGFPHHQSVLIRKTDLMQGIQIYKNLQNWLTMATHSVRYSAKGCPHWRPKGSSGRPELTVVSWVSSHQEAEESARRWCLRCQRRLKLLWRIGGSLFNSLLYL